VSGWVIRHVVRRALRSLWENLYLNSVAAGVIGAALLLMGVYLTVQYNLNNIVDTWGRDVHVSAYFHADVPEQRRFARRDELARDGRVAQVRYVSEDDAANWLEERIPDVKPVLDELGAGVLPASLEIQLTETSASPTAVASFVKDIEGPDFADIDYGQEWVERFNAFLSLLKLLGAVLGFLILAAALFLVINTVHLIVYNRRDELEIQKLVGATSSFVVAPFLIEGFVQGLVGAGLSMVGLWSVHRLFVVRLQEALQLGVAGDLAFLPAPWLALLCVSGVVLGVGAAMVAVQRFMMQAP